MQKSILPEREVKIQDGTLGTFAGVFTPSVLTILGIILFLRLGYVVGSAGLSRALIIIGLANAISVLTSISLSAIATNLKVKKGGDYYLISRTLGLEFGGAIGVVLFLAQSVSIAFYCIGFGEALVGLLPDGIKTTPQIISVLAVLLLFIFSWLGADWATRLQYVIMSMLAVALLSFFAGALGKWDGVILAQNWATPTGGPGFWILFAIFFPAVTGFTQGVSMSGDLKDPGKSLPSGTFSAVGLSIVIYFAVAILFAGSASREMLAGEYGAMKRVASIGFLIDAGVIGATLSSAMASFLGAPRILQSLAQDRIFPFLLPFAHGAGPTSNPRRGVLLSGSIALATIGLGKLNLIAPVVSMFFLISYGLLNYATFYEARSASPSFRPRFRWFDLRLSLLGCLTCLGAMLAINLAAGVVAIAVLFGIYQYLRRTSGPVRWADSRRSYHFQRVREHLVSASAVPEHPRDWRPQLLALSDHSERRGRLLHFASWLEGGAGLTTVVQFLEGRGVKMLKVQEEAQLGLEKDVARCGIKAFSRVMVVPNLQDGIYNFVQAYGVGPLKANILLLNWPEQLDTAAVEGWQAVRFGQKLDTVLRLGCNIIVFDGKKVAWKTLESTPHHERRIDIWWQDDATGRLMLLLAYLMTRDEVWEHAKIRVLGTGFSYLREQTIHGLEEMLEEARIQAEPEVVTTVRANTVVTYSADATLVFLPFRLRKGQLIGSFGVPLQELLPRLRIAAAVLAGEDIHLEAEPEEGQAAHLAALRDAALDSEKKAKQAEKNAKAAAEEAQERLLEIEMAANTGADEEAIAKLKAAAKEAEEKATKAARRAAKATAKAEHAARVIATSGEMPANNKKRSPTSAGSKTVEKSNMEPKQGI
jgi:amino acid transporter